MDTKIRNYDIVAGPSKDMLFDACKYAYNKTAKLTINFTVAAGYTMPKNNPGCAYMEMPITDIIIAGIEHEDGSGESFNLHGYCRANLNYFGEDGDYRPYKFEAYYNARTRKGCIGFAE